MRALREERGRSQRDFAAMAGTNQSYLWEIETGRTNATVDVLCRIADALGVSVGELIDF